MKYLTKPPLGTPLNISHHLNRGLVLYMPFSEGAGSKTQDLSGKGNHGTLTNMVQGTTSGWSGGIWGSAIKTDGTDDFVDAGLVGKPTRYTISAWIRPTLYGHACFVFSTNPNGDAPTMWGLFGRDAGNMEVYVSNGSGYQELISASAWNSATYPTGVFTFITATVDGATIKFYRNGLLISSVAQNTAMVGTVFKTSIGRFGENNALYYNGFISEVRIYNRALVEGEIKQLYTDPFCMYEQKGIFMRYIDAIKKGSFFFR